MESSAKYKALKDPDERNSFLDRVFDSLLHVSVRSTSGIVFEEDELLDACKKGGVPKLELPIPAEVAEVPLE